MLVWLVGILLLGYALRIANIDAFSFWTDEGLTPLRSSYPLSLILRNQIIIQDVVTIATHPPLFYLMIHFSRQLFGETDFAFRYPSLLASVLTIALLSISKISACSQAASISLSPSSSATFLVVPKCP